MQNRGTCCLKKYFNTERSKGHSEGALKYNKVRPSNYLFQLLLTLQVRPEENSGYFSNVQPCTITCTLDAFI